jgi:hypothetical protein
MKIDTFLKDAIHLEIKAGELYHLMWQLFPEDAGMWAGFCAHQECHALKLTGAIQTISFRKNIFNDPVGPNIDNMRRIMEKIDEAMGDYRQSCPAKKKALSEVLEMELSLKEFYFGLAESLPLNTVVIEILRDSIAENKMHIDKIREMHKNRGCAIYTPR